MVIPNMKMFLKVLGHEDYDRYILCTQMSLECFMKYNMDIFCHYDLDVDVCGFTAHSVATGCKRCEDNYNMLSSDKEHDSTCTYYNNICPHYSALGKTRDDKAMEKEYLEGAVVQMYKNALTRAENGDGCVNIRPPMMNYCSQRRRHDSFLLCEFNNPVNNEIFSVWLSKVEVVNVSINICNYM